MTAWNPWQGGHGRQGRNLRECGAPYCLGGWFACHGSLDRQDIPGNFWRKKRGGVEVGMNYAIYLAIFLI